MMGLKMVVSFYTEMVELKKVCGKVYLW